ncbi:MAG: glycine cleavage system protein GcvH [Burkholderiales bacterium]
MSAPADRRYGASHEWALREADGTISVGITDFAQSQLGDVVFVQPPEPGRVLRQGEACAVIESVKAAGDVHAPVAGTVVAVNATLAEAPEKINADAYAAWIFKLRPAAPAEYDALQDAAAYLRQADAG